MQVDQRGEWMLRVCRDESCSVKVVRIRPDPSHPDSWWVAELGSRPTWREAANEPTCPRCGSELQDSAQRLPDPQPMTEFLVA